MVTAAPVQWDASRSCDLDLTIRWGRSAQEPWPIAREFSRRLVIGAAARQAWGEQCKSNRARVAAHQRSDGIQKRRWQALQSVGRDNDVEPVSV